MNKNIWIYTGYTLEELLASNDPYKLELLRNCDVLVDGPFLEEERDLSLTFRGSRNQRIIDLSRMTVLGGMPVPVREAAGQ